MRKGKIILTVVVFVILAGVFASSFFIYALSFIPAGKDVADKNLALINSDIVGFKTLDFKKDAKVSKRNYSHTPKNTEEDNVALIQYKNGEWILSTFRGMSVNKYLTKEDIKNIDVIIFAIYDYSNVNYKVKNTGKQWTLRRQTANLYYFNARKGKFYDYKEITVKQPKDLSINKDTTLDLSNRQVYSSLVNGLIISNDIRVLAIRGFVIIVAIVYVVLMLKKKWKTE